MYDIIRNTFVGELDILLEGRGGGSFGEFSTLNSLREQVSFSHSR